MSQKHTPQQVIFEFRQIGTAIKVSAVDVATGTEVTVQGAASANRKELEQVALQKLRYILSKKNN